MEGGPVLPAARTGRPGPGRHLGGRSGSGPTAPCGREHVSPRQPGISLDQRNALQPLTGTPMPATSGTWSRTRPYILLAVGLIVVTATAVVAALKYPPSGDGYHPRKQGDLSGFAAVA